MIKLLIRIFLIFMLTAILVVVEDKYQYLDPLMEYSVYLVPFIISFAVVVFVVAVWNGHLHRDYKDCFLSAQDLCDKKERTCKDLNHELSKANIANNKLRIENGLLKDDNIKFAAKIKKFKVGDPVQVFYANATFNSTVSEIVVRGTNIYYKVKGTKGKHYKPEDIERI